MRRYKPRKKVFFDWSPHLAYVVGLIATDGCLSGNHKNIIFTSKDIEQIGNSKLILNLKGKVGFTRNNKLGTESYRIQFSNVQLYDWLLSIGLTSNKSLTLGSLDIPDKYFIDFLRGHLDGDGSITTYTDYYNTKKKDCYVYLRIFVRFISASKLHIDWLHSKIIKLTGIHGALHTTKISRPNQNPIHIIKFAKKDSLKLLARIYYTKNIPCLNRKRSIYTNFLKSSSVE